MLYSEEELAEEFDIQREAQQKLGWQRGLLDNWWQFRNGIPYPYQKEEPFDD